MPVSSEYSVPLLGIVLYVLTHIAGAVLPVMVIEGPILLFPESIPVGAGERSALGTKGTPHHHLGRQERICQSIAEREGSTGEGANLL